MSNYQSIKNEQPKLEKVFFAFSNEQFKENKQKAGISEDEKIYKGPLGAFGTKEGLNKMIQFYNNKTERIKNECKPQDVYDYEFCNYECDYVADDSEAIEIVVDYFGAERARQVKRKWAFKEI